MKAFVLINHLLTIRTAILFAFIEWDCKWELTQWALVVLCGVFTYSLLLVQFPPNTLASKSSTGVVHFQKYGIICLMEVNFPEYQCYFRYRWNFYFRYMFFYLFIYFLFIKKNQWLVWYNPYFSSAHPSLSTRLEKGVFFLLVENAVDDAASNNVTSWPLSFDQNGDFCLCCFKLQSSTWGACHAIVQYKGTFK